jgi:hypothetical protein
MRDLLSNNDVITNLSTFYKSLLGGVDVVRQMRFKSICNTFCNNFINYIAKTNRSIISRNGSEKLFQESEQCEYH